MATYWETSCSFGLLYVFLVYVPEAKKKKKKKKKKECKNSPTLILFSCFPKIKTRKSKKDRVFQVPDQQKNTVEYHS